jgi:hypothetical protein
MAAAVAVHRRSRRGSVNMGVQGVREHRGSAGMLSPNLIWTETGRRVVIDGGVNLGFLLAAMAAGVLQARVMEGGEGGTGSLQEDDVMLMVPLIGAERSCIGGSTGGRAAAEKRGSPALWSCDSGGGN